MTWEKIIKVFWIVYFVLIALISLWSASEYLKIFPKLTPADWLHLITMPIWAIIILAYLGKRKFLNSSIWKVILFFTLIDTLLSFISFFRDFELLKPVAQLYKSNLQSADSLFSKEPGVLGFILNIFLIYILVQFILISLPGFYANYKLAYPKGIRKRS